MSNCVLECVFFVCVCVCVCMRVCVGWGGAFGMKLAETSKIWKQHEKCSPPASQAVNAPIPICIVV